MHCSKCSLKETCDMCKSLELDKLDEKITFKCDYFIPKGEKGTKQ